MFRLLHKVITDPQRCFAVISVFEQIKFRTEIGQMLDLNTVEQETRKLNYKWIWVYPFTTRFFNSEYYMEIITNKTAYYTVFLPIYLGLVLCDCDISTLQSPLLKEICTVLGQYFQIKDDYLDVFADPSVLGKVRVDKFSYK